MSDTSDSPTFQDEQTAQDFVDKVTQGRHYTEAFDIEAPGGDGPDVLTLELSPILDRKTRAGYTKKLPAGWHEAGEKGSPDEVEDKSSLVPGSESMGALEDLVLESASHPHLAPSAIESVVREGMSDETLTRAGIRVIQMSSDDRVHKVQSFRRHE